jgi:hypothetical protein
MSPLNLGNRVHGSWTIPTLYDVLVVVVMLLLSEDAIAFFFKNI